VSKDELEPKVASYSLGLTRSYDHTTGVGEADRHPVVGLHPINRGIP
jgi:hypothetical protein